MVLNVSARGQALVTRRVWVADRMRVCWRRDPVYTRHFVNCRTMNRWEERLGDQGNPSSLSQGVKSLSTSSPRWGGTSMLGPLGWEAEAWAGAGREGNGGKRSLGQWIQGKGSRAPPWLS